MGTPRHAVDLWNFFSYVILQANNRNQWFLPKFDIRHKRPTSKEGFHKMKNTLPS